MTEHPKFHCNQCARPTKHEVEAESRIEGSDDWGTHWHKTDQITRCRGCDCVTFRVRVWDEETAAHNPEEIWGSESGYTTEYFPKRTFRKQPPWIYELEDDVQFVMTEVYSALDNGLCILAAMGARTAIDCLIRDAVGDHGKFAAGLKALETDGFITQDERGLLLAATDVGSAAAHRGYKPDPQDLGIVVEILENALQKHYITPIHIKSLTAQAKGVTEKVPPRPPSKKPGRNES